MKTVFHTVACAGLIMSLFSCGKSDGDKKAAAVASGTLKTSLLASTNVTSYVLTSAVCSNNADTGLFTGSFAADGGAKLDIKIKGFTTTGATYLCTQPEDNRDGDVGLKYNSCAVAISIPDTSAGVNSYHMYRETPETKAFTYGGVCTVTTQYTAPKVTLTVSCAGMIQTVFQSAVRNPLDPAITATVNSATSADCNI
ncbi:MAG: hypothetical protein H7318_07180 [Oligoflexus sp.]|nr:hypothetical protein [Oligoflexus sp.]